MHSGGSNNSGAASSVVSVAPATPMVKNMIGIAALVLEGRERDSDSPTHTNNNNNNNSSKSKDTAMTFAMRVAASSGASTSAATPLLYAPLDASAVALATSAATTSNWARAQNNRLAHIYRLKNRLLVEQQQSPQRNSPVPSLDYDQLCVSGGPPGTEEDFSVLGDPLQLLTSRSCRLTTPRSFLNLQMDKRHGSVSSTSSTGSSTGGGGGGGSVGGRRNSRSSPVPVIVNTPRIHCDDFLRTIGVLKGGTSSSSVSSPAHPSTTTLPAFPGLGKKISLGDEDESHYCDEMLNGEVRKWRENNL